MVTALPEELWIYIFSKIDSIADLMACSIVCKEWRALCFCEQRRLEFGSLSSQIKDAALSSFLMKCPKLAHLSLDHTNSGTLSIIWDFLPQRPKLTSLHFGGCSKVKTRGFECMASPHSTQLTALSFKFGRLTTESIESCFSTLSNLTELSLECCTQIVDSSLDVLSKCCPRLQAIKLKVDPNLLHK